MNNEHKSPRGAPERVASFASSCRVPICTAMLLMDRGLRPAQAQAVSGQLPVASGLLATEATPQTLPDPYASADALKIKGWNIPIVGAGDTLDQNLFGVRNVLAENGIGYFGFTNSYFSDNVLRHGMPVGNRDNQLYSGQLPTVFSSNFGYLNYDLSRFGIPNGQIVLGMNFVRTSWNSLGPNNLGLSTATYYQTFLHKIIEFKIGYIANSLEFLGTYVGGSLAGGVFGPNGTIPVEQGETTTIYPTPGINVKVNFPNHFYTKAGLERALSPDGVTVENHEDSGNLRFGLPNSGVFLIDESGYRVDPSPGVNQTWIRAAASYTSSNYPDLSKPPHRADHNYGLYVFGDRQLWQSKPRGRTTAQGIYAGFTVEYAPPALNRFTQYYEARLYSFGLIPTRPRDLLSLVFTDNVFSSYAIDTAHLANLLTHRNSESLSLNYSAHVYHGINLNGGLSFINNPTSVTYTHLTGSALNVMLGTVTFF